MFGEIGLLQLNQPKGSSPSPDEAATRLGGHTVPGGQAPASGAGQRASTAEVAGAAHGGAREPRFFTVKDGFTYCLLCKQFADEPHIASKKHRMRAERPER